MKRLIVFIFAVMLVLGVSACQNDSETVVPKDDGIVDNVVIDGEDVSAVDFVTESCNKFLKSEKYLERHGEFIENYEAEPFAVTRVIDLKAYGLGPNQIDIHYMLIKANCCWAEGEFSSSEIVLVADYDTGEVWSVFDCDESWQNDGYAKEYWTWVMFNSCFVSIDYKNDAIIGDDLETRAELTAKDIAAINAGIVQ